MRCRESAILLSGNLPMSSAVMLSDTSDELRLISMLLARLALIPVTTISSMWSSPCACTRPVASIADMAAPTAKTNFFLWNMRYLSAIPEPFEGNPHSWHIQDAFLDEISDLWL